MAGVFSQLEMAIIRVRVRSGMENARAKGKRSGRRVQYDAEFAAIANHALEECRAAQQAEHAVNGIG